MKPMEKALPRAVWRTRVSVQNCVNNPSLERIEYSSYRDSSWGLRRARHRVKGNNLAGEKSLLVAADEAVCEFATRFGFQAAGLDGAGYDAPTGNPPAAS